METNPNPSSIHNTIISEEDHQRQSLLLEDQLKSYISTLPKKTGGSLLSQDQYQYKGFWYGPIIHGVLAAERHFHDLVTHPPKVLLTSYIKSGTTWLKAILFATMTRTQFNCSKPSTHPLTKSSPHDLVPYLEGYALNNPLTPIPTHTSILQTHIPFNLLSDTIKMSSFPVIYVRRNLKDVVVSFWHFANKIRPKSLPRLELAQVVDMFCEGYTMYGPYWDHVSEYWNASQEMPHRVLFLDYEEMKEKPVAVVKRLAEFVGCGFSVEEEGEGVVEQIVSLCSFESLTNIEVNKCGRYELSEKINIGFENSAYYRKGEVGDYTSYMTSEMIDRLDVVIEEKLKEIKPLQIDA